MKNLKLVLVALFASFVFVGCNEVEDAVDDLNNGNDPSALNRRLASETIEEGDYQTLYKEYVYNEDGIVVRIDYSYGHESEIENYDSFVYNNSGQLIEVKSFTTGSEEEEASQQYTYSDGKISKIETLGTFWFDGEEYDYSSTSEFTYDGDKIKTINIVGDNENMAFRNFEYTEGNITKLEVDFTGEGEQWIALEINDYDSSQNVSRYLIPDWESVMFGTNVNNVKAVVFAEDTEMDGMQINAGDKLLHRSYTYDQLEMVESITHHETIMEEGGRVTTFQWDYFE